MVEAGWATGGKGRMNQKKAMREAIGESASGFGTNRMQW